ncbi:hypothetical protein [Candidatus Finniella inopinata]|uniref:Uncharacterized protein n=1 Tax=Candidatus Finniella inopinata TaxID=1696036 RepID=A0A4Q7DML7_9PROT|nr:hypothetical protein [Candidatus Finniella inopinata]RZI46056.1 hypothetical protein EQU50_03745 [Candidatus Finniella inopinata]
MNKTTKFSKSTFSDVVVRHERGTVNTLDFKAFLNQVKGQIARPRPKGMTYYKLPNLNANAGTELMLFHVHLPHEENDPFYPAILHHFIRPSVVDAGFTKEMFS